MRKLKKLFSLMLAVAMVFGLVANPLQAQAADAETYVKQLISYYKNYQEAAETDIERVLSELKQVDAATGEAWEKIMDYWSEVNSDGFANIDTVPEGLPEDNSMAIVILGFALNDDGTMKDELIGRLQTGLNIANQYTNSYVVVTGGGTAKNNPDVTEGGLMGEWLLEQGLDESRLIVENRAPDTVGNAKYTYEILKSEYPQVDSVVLVTSDYHVPRGCILYYSKFVLDALETNGEPLTIVSNAGYGTGSNGYESISLQASGVCSVAGVSSSSLPGVALSVLDSLTVSQDDAYLAGEELNLTVMAKYDTGYSRDVSDLVTISGFDPALGADQTVTVSYTENGVTVNGKFALSETEKEINDYRSKINALLEQVHSSTGSVYTEETLEILELAVDHAEAVMAKEDAADDELKSAYETLGKAMAALEVRENIALKKTVTASHNSAEASKITDGNKSTYWSSYENGNIPIEESSFVIDLAGIYAVDTITAVPYFGGNERYYHYDISVSTDNENWTKVAEQRSTEDTLEAGATFVLDETVNARYIKVEGVAVSVVDRDDINNFHMTEVMAYGDLVQEVEDSEVVKTLENVAIYGEVTVDSGTKNYVIADGTITNSYWGSANGIDAAYCMIELPWETEVEEFKVVTYYNNTSKWYTYEVLVSTDNENWTSVGKYETEENRGSEGYTITLDEPVKARYVKVKGLATNNTNFHLVEVQVYGTLDNIVKGKSVETNYVRSSDAKYAASNITDGTPTTSAYWDSGDVTTSVENWTTLTEEQLPYAIIDLEGIYELDVVNAMTYYNTSRYYQYRIYTSLDGEAYTLFAEKNDTDTSYFSNSFDADGVQARYIKIVGTYNSANPGFHLLEVRAAGTLVPEAPADYSAVNAAKAKVPEDLSVYTIETVVDLKLALLEVEEGLTISYQAEVDAMAKAIEDAIAALEEVALESISVATEPKVVYTEGETFDPTGLVLNLVYDNNTTESVAYSEENAADFSFAPNAALTTTDTAVTITYGGKETTLAITVEAEEFKYTAEEPFVFPGELDVTETLEAEYMEIHNTGENEAWPMVVADRDWASNGKIIDATNTGDSAVLYYDAPVAGVYTVTLTYRSGDSKNAFSWTEADGKIAEGNVTAGASDEAGANHTVEFEIEVLTAGKGTLTIHAGTYNAPQLDKFDIALKPVDKEALNEAIAAAEALNSEDYVDFTAVSAAIEAAKAVRDNADATQAEVDAAVEELNEVIDALVEVVPPVTKDALAKAIEDAEALDETVYTTESWATLETAVAEAEAVMADEEATQAEVDAATEAIADAIEALEEKPVISDEVIRISGTTRYETGYEVADEYKAKLGVDKFDAVVVATGKNFADALSGSYLAVVKNAPILLTNGNDDNVAMLHEYIKANVTAGGKVYILGGEAAVPASVAAIEGYDVVRLSGPTRYDTNLAILEEAGITGDELIVATGKNFADSLSASAVKKPILLVKPGAELTDGQKAIADAMNTIYIVGGEGAVDAAIAEELAAYAAVERVYGATRQETSVAIAEKFLPDAETVVAASAKNFPDGLCGGPLAAALDAPLLLTTDGKTEAAADYTAANAIASGYVLGGEGALANESVVDVFGLESADEIISK